MVYDIHLYATDELLDHCENEHDNSTQALDRIKTYLDGAYDRMNGHSASISVKSDRVYAPTEMYGESFTTTHPCYPQQHSFDGLLGWWITNAQCRGYDKAGFCNMLVTAAGYDSGSAYIGGGITDNNNFAISITGIMSAKVNSTYQDYALGGEYKAVRTAHHELGHMMMNDGNHNWGETYQHGLPDHYMTPMYTETVNRCNEYQTQPGTTGWEMKWSDCCESEW